MKKMYFNRHKRGISYIYNDNKSSQTLLFIHGAGSNLDQFEGQVNFFNDAYNCISVTLYGHDVSQANEKFIPQDFELSRLAEDVILLLEDLKITSVHIIGNSAGGLVGFEIIKSNQVHVLSITTFGTAPKIMYPKSMVSLISKMDAVFLIKNPMKYLTFAAKASSKHEHTIHKITEIMMESKHAAHHIRSQIGRYDYLDLISKMKIPYLLLTGPHDKSINKVLKRHVKTIQKNPYIQMIQLDHSGHFMNMDQPDIFNEVVKQFVQKNSK